MKSLQFYFCHPVKGKVTFSSTIYPEQRSSRDFNTDDTGQMVDLAIDELPDGKWKASLEWEYEGKNFFMERYFSVET